MLFILHMSSRDGGGVGVFNTTPTQKRKKDKAEDTKCQSYILYGTKALFGSTRANF